MESKDIIISEGVRPLWHRIIAAFLYTVILLLLVLLVFSVNLSAELYVVKQLIHSAEFIFLLFVFALRFSTVRTLYFDLNERKYKKEFSVGPICVGKWKSLPNIEYISVFRQIVSSDPDGDGVGMLDIRYDINVWHDTSKHFTIYSGFTVEPVFEIARYIALKLKVDLLDATIPNNFKWVELEEQNTEVTPLLQTP